MASKFGKFLKKAVPFIAGIAISIFAAPISAAIGLTASVGAFAGTTIVGAGIGGVAGTVAGYDPLESIALGATAGLSSAILGGGAGQPGGANPAATPPPGVVGGGPAPALTTTGQTAVNGVGGTQQVLAGAGKAPGFAGQYAGAVKSSIIDPQKLAGFTIQVAAQGLAAAIAGTGFASAEEKAAYVKQAQYLDELRVRDAASYARRVKQAEAFLQQAKQNDPTYVAQQSANRQGNRDAATLKELERSAAIGGRPLSEGDKIRAALGTSTNTATAYDSGFTTGLARQTDLAEAGLNAVPETNTGLATAFGDLASTAGNARDGNQKEQANTAKLFGIFGAPNPDDADKQERQLGYSING